MIFTDVGIDAGGFSLFLSLSHLCFDLIYNKKYMLFIIIQCVVSFVVACKLFIAHSLFLNIGHSTMNILTNGWNTIQDFCQKIVAKIVVNIFYTESTNTSSCPLLIGRIYLILSLTVFKLSVDRR